MKPILNIYKPIGLTPLQVIKQIKTKSPEYKDIPIGYAGRLDPLAHGVLLLMVGEANKQRQKYLSLTKDYAFKMIFGIETDTYDVMGIIKNNKVVNPPKEIKDLLMKFMKQKIGRQQQLYPAFSSKTVDGKPLHWWAKQKKLSTITIPQKEITIEKFELIKLGQITTEDLKEKVNTSLKLVEGDFRQEKIFQRWDILFKNNPNHTFVTATCSITCSSGTYVRSLIHEFGKELRTGAIALDILRTRVGDHTIDQSLQKEK